MSDKRCCVPGCKDSKGKLVLHRFPNPEQESERFRVWIYAIGGDVLGLEDMHIFKYRRVCHSHFEEKFQCRNNRISNIAVPTLNMPATLSNKPAVMKRKPMKEILNLAEPSTSTDHYSECSVHQLHTKMEGNTSHKENLDPVTAMQAPVISTNPVVIKKRAEMVLDPVTPMQDPVISTNPVVIKKRAETFLGGALADKKKTKGILREEYEDADLLLLWIIFSTQLMAVFKRKDAKTRLGPATAHSIHHKTCMDAKKVFASMMCIFHWYNLFQL